MFKKLVPYLFLLFSSRVMAFENTIEIIEYFDDVKVIAYVNKSDIDDNAQWIPLEGPPPLTINDAVHAIYNYIKEDSNPTEFILSEIELKRIPHHEKNWHYLVKTKYKSGEDTRQHFYVVLMDGKVISAIREPESIK